VKNYPAHWRQEDFQPWALEQSAGSTKGKPERTRKKARSETKIQLDRYNNLSKCAFTKSSQNRPELPSAENAHAVRKNQTPTQQHKHTDNWRYVDANSSQNLAPHRVDSV